MASLSRIQELADLLGRSDPKVRRLVENARLFPESADSALRLLQVMAKQKGIDLSNEPVFSVPDELPRRGTELGTVLRGDKPVGAYMHAATELPGNQGVFGVTGCGKSSLVGLQSERWIQDGLSVIIFDVADEYGWLIKEFTAEQLPVLSARNFPLAPFENPVGSCLSDLSWLSQVVGVCREIFYLRDGSCNLLLKVGGDIYRERKVLEGSRDFPLLSEVFTELTRRKFSIQSRHAGFLETLVNRFHGLLQSFPGMNAKRSLVPAQILQHSLIIRMSDLNPAEIDTFVSLFLIWLLAALQGRICNATGVILVWEEMHLFASRQKMARHDLSEPLAVRLLRTGRKHGVSVVAIDQIPSEIPAGVLGNLSTRIVFRLTNSPCINAIAYSMGLDRPQAEGLAELPPRRAVMQTTRIPKPFLLNVVEIPERQRPSTEELREREKGSLEMLDYELPDVDVSQVLLGQEKKKEDRGADSAIRGDLYKVLARICERPYELIEERIEGLGFDRAREYRARRALEKIGMIALGDKAGAKLLLYVPTAKGIQWARNMGLTVHQYKSGIAHEMVVRKIRESLGKFSSRISFVSEGEGLGVSQVQPDLLAKIRGIDGDKSGRVRIVAIQVNSTNRAESEARTALELCAIDQIDMVVVIAKNKRTGNAIERNIGELQAKPREGKRAGSEAEGMAEGKGEGALVSTKTIEARLRVLDFEACVNAAYDWNWIIG
jgi:hypothetical protein